MKFQIKTNYLIKKLNLVIKIATSKNSIPYYTAVLIKIKNSEIELLATNSIISIKTILKQNDNLKIKQSGEILVNCDYLLSIIKKINNEFIELEEIEKNILSIKSHQFHSELNCFDIRKFSRINFNLKGEKIIINYNDFIEIRNKLFLSINQNEKRIILKGYNFRKNLNKLYITSTDSFRLSFAEIQLKKDNIIFDKTLPYDFVELIYLIINNSIDKNKNIIMYFDNNNVIIEIDNTIIQTKIIIGKYPNAKNIIPIKFNSIIIINTNLLKETIERVASLSSKGFENNILNINIKKENLLFSCNVNQIGKTTEKVNNFKLKGEEQRVNLNNKYILDALKSFSCEKIEMNIIDDSNPIIIKDPNNNNYKQLILPIRTY